MTVGSLIKAHKERKVDMLEDLEIGKNHFYFFRINFMLRNLIINHVISVETDIRYHINIFNIFTELVRIYVYIYIYIYTTECNHFQFGITSFSPTLDEIIKATDLESLKDWRCCVADSSVAVCGNIRMIWNHKKPSRTNTSFSESQLCFL